MKRNHCRILLIFLAITVFPLPGCWNYREMEHLSIVAGVAIDKGKFHKYLATLELISIRPGKDTDIESKTVTGEGNSILEALRNSYNITGKMGYFNHTRVFIISQDVAKEGILPIVDLLNRSPLIRISVAILVAKTKTAQEVLRAQGLTQPIKSFQISDAFDVQQRSLSKTIEIEVYQAINAMGGEGTSLFLPTVGVATANGQPAIELSGIAVFKRDRLVGLLNGEESKYVFFVRNEVRRGILLEYMDSQHSKVSLRIKDSQTKLKAVSHQGNPLMKIDIKTKADIWEIDSPNDYITEKGEKTLKSQAERALKENILRVIHKVQQNYDADIFGFGSKVRSQLPGVWRKVKPNWDEMFKHLKVDIKPEFEIQGSGMAIKPLKAEGR